MTVTVRKTMHLDPPDLQNYDTRNKGFMNLLDNKFIVRSDNTDEGKQEMEEAFTWLKDNCEHHYHVRGPEHDEDTIKFYVYFENSDEALLFKATFPLS